MNAPGGATWVAYSACAWMLIFAGFHVYWALGGTLGLPPGESLSDNTVLFVIDIVAIPLSLAGAALALALARPWGSRFSRRALLFAGWAAAALMIVHALPALAELAVYFLGGGESELDDTQRFSLFLYEPFWMLGGTLFALATWNFQRRTRPRPA